MGLYRYLRRKLNIQHIKEICEDTQNKTTKCLSGICASGGGIQTRLDTLLTQQRQCLSETESSRISRSVFLGPCWEDNFYSAIRGTDIEERYDRLVNGLSEKDTKTVETILLRIMLLCGNGIKPSFQPEEAERIYRNQKALYSLSLNDHCFVYNNFKLPLNEFELSTFVCNYGLDLIDHPEYVDDRDIIDAGAYIGDSALLFDRFFQKCRRVYAFEPNPESYSLMEKTIAMNRAERIVPVKLGLGDTNTESDMTCHGMGSTLLDNQFNDSRTSVANISIVRLDDYCRQNNIVPGVIKTDLEGFEMHFLQGALETIRKYRPIMVLSIYHSADDFFGIKPFIESLNLGYKFKLFKADDGMILCGTCLVCIPEG